jgi:hypothetical protein
MSHMTCQELRLHFEDLKRMSAGPPPDSAELAAHTAICAACSRFIEEQAELSGGLRVLRESAPEISASLDKSVLANYDVFAAKRVNVARLAPRRRITLIAAFEWTAAVVAAIVIAGVGLRLFFPAEEISTTPDRVTTQQLQPAPKSPSSPESKVELSNTSGPHPPAIAKAKRKPAVTQSRARDLAETQAPDIRSTAADPVAAGFQSLMYCDVLSCGGPMEMIRVQLPPSAVSLAPAWTRTDGVVYADVLVGPDGIARGIRIVQ